MAESVLVRDKKGAWIFSDTRWPNIECRNFLSQQTRDLLWTITQGNLVTVEEVCPPPIPFYPILEMAVLPLLPHFPYNQPVT